MSGTRSHFQKAQVTNPLMTKPPATEALIVAHGQPSDPEPAQRALTSLAYQVAAFLPDWTIGAATLAAPGKIEDRLAQMAAVPLVYPLFMTDGWFTQTALPKRLGIAKSRILAPLGLSPHLPAMASQSLLTIVHNQGWQPEVTRLLIAAHGSASGRSKPAQRAYQFAQALSRQASWKDVRVGFLEQEPYVSSVAVDCGHQSICVPFFAAEGYHVSRDIQTALRKGGFTGILSDPVGRACYIPQLIANAFKSAHAATDKKLGSMV